MKAALNGVPNLNVRDGWISITQRVAVHSHRMVRRYAADAYFG